MYNKLQETVDRIFNDKNSAKTKAKIHISIIKISSK